MIRVLSAVFLISLFLFTLLVLPRFFFDLLISLVAFWSYVELYRMFLKDRRELLGSLAFGMVVFFAALCKSPSLPLLIVSAFFGLALLFMRINDDLRGIAERLGIAVFGSLYLGLALPFWSELNAFGAAWVLLVLVPACLTDTFGLVVGKAVGRRPLAPIVSPKKTIEGFVGALGGSLLGTLSVRALFLRHELSLFDTFIVAGIVWIASPLGDLIESMIKRSAGVKDSGSIIPGHGGILDRVDALVFAAPAAYLYLVLIRGQFP